MRLYDQELLQDVVKHLSAPDLIAPFHKQSGDLFRQHPVIFNQENAVWFFGEHGASLMHFLLSPILSYKKVAPSGNIILNMKL
jgi:GH35 family endo-1,4-beta-xylanase